MGTPLTRALVAAYLEYALTHLRWVPRPLRAALHLDLFDQPGHKRACRHLSSRLRETFLLASDSPRNPRDKLSHPKNIRRSAKTVIKSFISIMTLNYVWQTNLDRTVWTLQKTLDRLGRIVYSHGSGLKTERLRASTVRTALARWGYVGGATNPRGR